jgi:hypothetical protein
MFQSAENQPEKVLLDSPFTSFSPGGSKPGWTAAPELFEALTVRWPGQYWAHAKEVISLIEAVPLGQRCGPVRAYGRLAASFPGRRIQGGLRTSAAYPPKWILLFFSFLKPPGRPLKCFNLLTDVPRVYSHNHMK